MEWNATESEHERKKASVNEQSTKRKGKERLTESDRERVPNKKNDERERGANLFTIK